MYEQLSALSDAELMRRGLSRAGPQLAQDIGPEKLLQNREKEICDGRQLKNAGHRQGMHTFWTRRFLAILPRFAHAS
jgi:hypothetical protein